MTSPSIVWFRDDLRLADNPALRAALDRGEPVIGLYVLDEESPGIRPLGGAAKWWLHHSLASLADRLEERGSRLVLRRGKAASVVREAVTDAGAGAVFWNRRYGGPERDIDTELKEGLSDGGVEVASFAASLLFEPWTVKTGSGSHFSVYSPFWRACLALPSPRAPLPEPREIAGPGRAPASDRLEDWELLPTAPDWAGGLRETWEPGEPAAKRRLREFLDEDLGHYDRARNHPAAGATSQLSPRLRWGELSPHIVWHAAVDTPGASGFLSEIGWREFAWHTLYHFPDLATKNLRPEFDAFPWPRLRPAALEAWQQGRTGFAIVDAGMRELWETGYMHNRVRMVTASFLIKNLLIDWRRGEEWFWDCLVDADGASNTFNWQWVAGSGADAAPYFRVFNPELQADKFDKGREYIGRWAPEYRDADGQPPTPMVDLKATRQDALAAYEKVKQASRR
ncbi:DNA photolyase family protein [Microbacterium sp. EYE_5]|uniref:cryptochrome/photolyase family protein n=1 Tax=unclassified Microbacterium TaxID=2609290 RepID=UPI002003CAE8|nr:MULTISPECIES: deoxyribodipyrimidine photo-lyase [unclassified Microbacterium]MCK6079956.1 DNA photolyase family protein [Microbacterium sp. EYE_382]MCK6085227.1 DNA photolyase family protein [Microbacterium sp. EYE_384]MCK6122548.1 DNA photolyase family protein [Microbacterium sp. EYE_80]MCK6125990.1 DNA photolyase family protein [Microbacterium sp. EYE_79]MCK6140911.1 DNA photolyase family protein [Microbacterium sp. EYE_39]